MRKFSFEITQNQDEYNESPPASVYLRFVLFTFFIIFVSFLLKLFAVLRKC